MTDDDVDNDNVNVEYTSVDNIDDVVDDNVGDDNDNNDHDGDPSGVPSMCCEKALGW